MTGWSRNTERLRIAEGGLLRLFGSLAGAFLRRDRIMILRREERMDTTTTGMAAILASMTTITDLVTSVWELMTSNPLLSLFLAASLLGVGVGVFRKIKRASRG